MTFSGGITLSNILATNNGSGGISFPGKGTHLGNALDTADTSAQIVQLASIGNDFPIAAWSGDGVQISLKGNLVTDTPNCKRHSNVTGFNQNCTNGPNSSANLYAFRSIASSYVGMVSSDSTNRSQSNGQYSYNSISDWVGFDSLFRAWGVSSGSSFPSLNQRGNCTSGSTCQIWDFSLSASDSTVRGNNFNVTSPNAAFVAGQACPAAVNGNEAVTDNRGVSYLTNAIEIYGTGGNNDGLCESHW